MTTRPRVLYLCGWPLGARGEGAVSFVYEQIEALAGDVEAAYAEARFATVWRWARRLVGGSVVAPIGDLWPAGVRALTIWAPRWPTRVTRRTVLEDLEHAAPRIARAVRRAVGPIDLIHAHVVLPAGFLGAALAEELGVPLVLQEHSGPFEMHLDTEEKRTAVRRVLGSAAVVAAVGGDLAARMAPCADRPDPIRITPNLVRTDRFAACAPPAASGPLRLITVGALHPVKGLDILLEAAGHLKRAGHSFELRIVGDGPERPALLRQIVELGLSSEVSLLGARSRADTARAMAWAHIYVCASRCETFGLAPAEALSVGRPVVTTRCGGPEAFVDASCGALVPVADASALMDGIVATWKRIEDFDPYALHRRIDERFGPAAFRRRMLALYRDVLSPSSHA